MTEKLAFYTISDHQYVDLVPAMFQSVREHYPEADLFLFVIGTGYQTKPLDSGVQIIYIGDVLDPGDLEQRLCFYLGVELATSVRPHCFQYLFSRDYGRVLYLDPDIYVFRRMTEVDVLLDEGLNGVVTPHALKSISAVNPMVSGGDMIFLQVGIFNLGFLALRNTRETAKMLEWWRDKLKWQCVVDTKVGLFVDQRWLEFLPVYFDGFYILKLPTYNLAPWNEEHYKIIQRKKMFYVDSLDQPVAFIHFSGIKRSQRQFSGMMNAFNFYSDKLSTTDTKQYKFRPFPLRTTRGDITWDKVMTFLYKDFVVDTGDRESTPLNSDQFFEYATGIDAEVGIPRYLRKIVEIFPRFAASVLCTGDSITFDNLLAELKNEQSPYRGCAYPETIHQLKRILSEVALPPNSVSSPRRNWMVRSFRTIFTKSSLARSAYTRLRAVAINFFRINNIIYENNQRHQHQDMMVKILLKRSRDADIVK